MLKKIIVLTCSFMLMSCQENDKAKLQDLINKKDFVNSKFMAEEKLGQNPQDNYYNGAMGYILSVECLSTNCVENKPEMLKKINFYSKKSNGLAKVDDAYFVDFYQKTLANIVTLATQQNNIQQAKVTLKEFINQKNPRIGFIYNELFKGVLNNLLAEDLKKSSLNLALLQEFNFKLTKEQKFSIDLLLNLENNAPFKAVKTKLKNFNRAFIGSKLSDEFLVALAPAIVEYSINNNLGSIVEILEESIKERSTIFGENIAVVHQPFNIKAYAKGIELVSKSEAIIKHVSEENGIDALELVTDLENMALKLNSDNKQLWLEHINNLIEIDAISQIYKNIKIELIPSTIVIANNDLILKHAEEVLEEKSITNILDEMVFRDDSNKDIYTQKTISLVEKALKSEITKNNLDGIFEYLNYVPSTKSKFKDELNQRLNEYIDLAWSNNNFINLNKLINLHSDLNETQNNSILVNLFEDYLLTEESEIFFTANNIKQLIKDGSDNQEVNIDMAAKYDFIIGNLKNAEIQTTLFSIARKMQGIYSQSKLFSYFSEVFAKEKVDDLIIDSINSALAKDEHKELLDLVKLSGFLINKVNTLPKTFIADEIIPRFNTLEDIKQAWSIASSKTKASLIEYNVDIKNLMKVVENDKANKKITAASYIGKIKSKEFLPFVANFKKLYKSYVQQVQGFYIKDKPQGGPEIIQISATKDLLKVNVDFISRLGSVENLDKYKLDRGEVISKKFTTYYNPITSSVKLNNNYKAKELKVFTKAKKLLLDGKFLALNSQKYRKVKNMFAFNTKYGIVEQITEKTQDNFHIMPEGSSFTITEEVSENLYKLKLLHPAMTKPIIANAVYNPQTVEFSFEYDYSIKLFDKTFSAKAKCQIIDNKAYCAVQDKYWKRQEYSVILKALQVK